MKKKGVVKMKLIDSIDVNDLITHDSLGIFQVIQAELSDHSEIGDWFTESLAYHLDIDYYLTHSGGKELSGAFKRILDNSVISDDDKLVYMAHIILNRFALKWEKLHDAITTDYNPLHNYDMEQVETPDITKKKNVATNVTTETSDDDTTNKVRGFNSSSSSVVGESSHGATITVSGDKQNNEEIDTETGTRSLTRSGNIGVTTSQQMLQSEIDLRNNYNFMNQLMDDVDSVLCLLVY